MAGFLDALLRFESVGALMYLGYPYLVGYLSSPVYLAFVIPVTGGSGLSCNVMAKMRILHSLYSIDPFIDYLYIVELLNSTII